MQDLTINAVGAQGDGLSRTEDGKPAFVPLTLPGERVRATMDGARGEVEAILAASPDRIVPSCKHFGTCGGCALQHWAAQPYLAWKAEQIRIQLSMGGLETEILPTFASPPASRRRVALHARKGGKGQGARLGFKERRSWNLTPIEECPVTDPRIIAALPALARLAEPFLEHPKSAPTLHVTLTGTGLDIDVTGVERKSGGLSADARMRAAMAAGEGDFARVTLAGETVYGARQPLVKLGQAVVALPPGAFLQAVPAAERAMVDFAVAESQGANRIADLYCGVGTFTFRLAEIAGVYAAEMSAPAIAALKAAVGPTSGLKPITAEARDLVRRPVLSTELAKTDVVVIDPPRAGAAEQTVEIAKSKVGKVVGVSCNPATFAKDARVLVDAGFRLEKVAPVDQFVWSPHIELVGVFTR
ncbi:MULTISPECIES: class I SAM-dependent RNA methyltransferase [Caulobacter]|jgi:23S rRNA (uracil1939-C5)-methyltransferase|uniref:23S rRNA methyltransferase n=1 Tax=Caulobacter vibrioides OR37 TaxID=1292034 RepID=R0E7S1_CAUVI|nr:MULTISPECIES: class I SAM-dependent RNA methyltransferase [Caulobacter]ENZ81548.1 23S rRNA methyltransferase [Caulobacter vibrioides OR37]MBQ1563356.1 class I SAM-dependent RNA methyltransferase [Caulobacter sp.]